MAKLYNRAGMSTATTGTGTITLGSALTSPKKYLSFADSGVQNLDDLTILIEDGAEFEISRGVYTSSGTTVTRDTVLKSSNSGSKINLSGSAKVFIIAAAEDIRRPFSGAMVKKSATQTGANYTSLTTITWDSEVYDTDSYHDTVTNNSRLTVPVGVTHVRISWHLFLQNFTGGHWAFMRVLKNGTDAYDGRPQAQWYNDATQGESMYTSGVIPVSAGDYFELQLLVENTDTSIDINSQSWFAIEAVVTTQSNLPGFNGALVRKAAAQTAANYTSITPVAWTAEDYDTHGWHDNSTNNTRLTVPAGVSRVDLVGYVNVSGGTGTAGTYFVLKFYKNGVLVPTAPTMVAHNSITSTELSIVALGVSCVPGDYFELYFQYSTDTSITVDTTSFFQARAVETFMYSTTQSIVPYLGARIRKSADQTGANYFSGSVVSFDIEDYDSSGFHDNVTNNSRLTIPTGVTKVKVRAFIMVGDVAATNYYFAKIYKNGSEAYPGCAATTKGSTVAGDWREHIETDVLDVSAGDYFELYLISGDASVTVSSQSWLAIEVVERSLNTYVNPWRGARVRKSAAQNAANYSAGGNIAWDVEDYDTDNFHDNTTNNSRFTIPSGVYKIRLNGYMNLNNVNAGSYMIITFMKNGAVFNGGGRNTCTPNVTGGWRFSHTSDVLDVVPGDYFDMNFTASDTSVDIQTDSHFAIEVVTATPTTSLNGYLRKDTTEELTTGYTHAVYDSGTKSSGTFTPSYNSGTMQKAVNGGAHTLAPPSGNGSMIIKYTNNASAGAITTSGFTKVSGDALTTTNGHVFLANIITIDGTYHLTWVAMQ